ncbi:hypothetical protein F4780DRAFT_784558 [Xylariomycetidae sp. FL0641]|nr:hypothetical protein F4780DRAFT_784558 [Xylariomycetidae sp. FL0641]
MSAAEYYNPGGGNGNSYPPSQNRPSYPPSPQYAPSPSHSPLPYPPQQPGYGVAPSPYPSQPTYAHSPAPAQSNNYLTPYPQQPQYARPGSAHSDAGRIPPPYPDDRDYERDDKPLPRPRSADPYSSRRRNSLDDEERGEDGERGLGATLIGGGAGGVLGHKMGKGKLGTLLGSAVGAVAANIIEHKLEERRNSHGHHNPYGHGSSHHGSSGGLLVMDMATTIDTTAITATMDITDITDITDIMVIMGTTSTMIIMMIGIRGLCTIPTMYGGVFGALSAFEDRAGGGALIPTILPTQPASARLIYFENEFK